MPQTTVDTSTLARLFDVSPRYIRMLVAQGVLFRARDPKTGDELMGRFPFLESVKAYTHFLRERLLGEGDEGELTFRRMRIKKMQAEAEEAELKLRAFKRNLHRSDDLEAYYNAFRKHALTRFRSIADRTTPALIGQANFQTIFNTLMDEIYAALTDVSNFDPKSDPELKAYGEAALAALTQKSNGAQEESDEFDAD